MEQLVWSLLGGVTGSFIGAVLGVLSRHHGQS